MKIAFGLALLSILGACHEPQKHGHAGFDREAAMGRFEAYRGRAVRAHGGDAFDGHGSWRVVRSSSGAGAQFVGVDAGQRVRMVIPRQRDGYDVYMFRIDCGARTAVPLGGMSSPSDSSPVRTVIRSYAPGMEDAISGACSHAGDAVSGDAGMASRMLRRHVHDDFAERRRQMDAMIARLKADGRPGAAPSRP